MRSGEDKDGLFRALPSVSEVLEWPEIGQVPSPYPRPVLVRAVRAEIQSRREQIKNGEEKEAVSRQDLIVGIWNRVKVVNRSSLRRVVNGTGVVLHTNLGRAQLDPLAVQQIVEAACSYTNLELELDTGRRGERSDHLQELLCELTGAEAAFVVNNNAGAVLLVLNSLAQGREVIVSRGELIEIGGSFRLPEVMEKSGAILREVGTTNRTYIKDYSRAIGPETALLLRAHPSNYRIEGFSAAASRSEMAALGREKGLPVFEDLGSGLMLNLPEFESSREPVVPLALREGMDLVSFSGDKLLGGPQAGIILGNRELLEQIRRNPLARALRIDKLTLAGLEATLRIYRDEGLPPVISRLRIPLPELKKQARKLARELQAADPGRCFQIEMGKEESAAGGGSLPGINLPTWAVFLSHPDFSPEELARSFRSGNPPVMGRIKEDRLLLDLRTIQANEVEEITQVFREIVRGKLIPAS